VRALVRANEDDTVSAWDLDSIGCIGKVLRVSLHGHELGPRRGLVSANRDMLDPTTPDMSLYPVKSPVGRKALEKDTTMLSTYSDS
jgi:hypothetical protein